MHHAWHFDFTSALIANAVWAALSFGLQQWPMPQNKYWKVILGVVQVFFANIDLARRNISSASLQNKLDQ